MTICARDDNGAPLPAFYPGASQKLSFSSSSAQSTAVGLNTTLIRLLAQGADVRVVIGEDPVATTSDMPLLAGVSEYFAIRPGEKIAAIRDASTNGTLNITEGANF